MADRIAVVTGAGSGIGRASALALLAGGYSVVPTDVSDPDSVAALFEKVKSGFGRLDVLFNNAGTNVPTTNFGDFTWEQWRSVVAVNLNGMFLCANAAFRLMRDQSLQGGRIINNGSISAHAPRPGSAAYTSTKHAITGLTKSIALDGRQFNIACGQIDIGNAATPMTRRMERGVPQADGSVKVEPTMDVEHVAQSIRFMADLPLDTNIQFITIMATKMPFIGRG
jgi:NAD(P)-dependent dehydrogenase (short-subunit alcohol dehydrogenase family)